jgi:excisionase family DNA binding protein
MDSTNPLFTTEEVAKYLNIEVITVRRLVQRGELAAYKVGGEYRFSEADLQDFLNRKYVPVKKSETQDDASAPFTKPIRDRWNRFTADARQAMLCASEEAQQYSQSFMEPEHLLVALMCDEESSTARLLAEFGLSLNRARLAAQSVTSAGRRDKGRLHIAASVTEALERAANEAQQLGHDTIGTEHFLLGLLAYDNIVLVLKSLDASPDDVREAVVRLMSME